MVVTGGRRRIGMQGEVRNCARPSHGAFGIIRKHVGNRGP